MKRTSLLALATALGSLAAAAPAGASTLTAEHLTGTLIYQGATGESNQVQASGGPGGITIQDDGAISISVVENGAATPGCSLEDATQVRCAFAGLSAVRFRLGGGADQLDASGLTLPVVVRSGGGSNRIQTGSGDDKIFAQNGKADRIRCGAGNDSVVADPQDTIAGDCEQVDLTPQSTPGTSDPGSGSTTSTSGGDSGADPTNPDGGPSSPEPEVAPPPVSLPDPVVALTHLNAAVVHIGCSPTFVSGCRGDIFLDLPGTARPGRTAKRAVAARGHFLSQQRHRIGRGHFKLAPGQSAAVPVSLRGHFAIQSRRRRKRALLEIVLRDPSGKVVAVQSRTVTLKLSNKWSRIRRHRSSR